MQGPALAGWVAAAISSRGGRVWEEVSRVLVAREAAARSAVLTIMIAQIKRVIK